MVCSIAAISRGGTGCRSILGNLNGLVAPSLVTHATECILGCCHQPRRHKLFGEFEHLIPLAALRQVALVKEMGQMKAALVIGDPCRLESIARFFGPNGVRLPMPPQDVVDKVVRRPYELILLTS